MQRRSSEERSEERSTGLGVSVDKNLELILNAAKLKEIEFSSINFWFTPAEMKFLPYNSQVLISLFYDSRLLVQFMQWDKTGQGQPKHQVFAYFVIEKVKAIEIMDWLSLKIQAIQEN